MGRRPHPVRRLPSTFSERGLDRVDQLRNDMAARAAGIHAAQADLVDLVGRMLRDEDAWNGPGIRSIGHWGSIQLGLPAKVVNDMADTSAALEHLPELAEEFTAGRLGFDKVRAVAAVATPDLEAEFVELARQASVEQIRRITRAYAREHPTEDPDDPDHPGPSPERRRRNRGLWCETNPDGDGLVRIIAKLAPDDAAAVMAAVSAHAEDLWRDAHGDPTTDDETTTEGPAGRADPESANGSADGSTGPADAPGPDGDDTGEAGDRHAAWKKVNPPGPGAEGDEIDPKPYAPRPALLADGLVALAGIGMAAGPTPTTDGEPAEVVLHVDLRFLNGETDTGHCQLDLGPTVPRDSARRLACDARITALVEDALGRPLGVGRTTRTVPRWLRRALKNRDGGCTFPGCAHTRYLQAHHIWHWADGGPTDLRNLILVCHAHHKVIHDHHLRITLHDNGYTEFHHPDGTRIGRPPERADRGHTPQPRPESDPVALAGGTPDWSLELTLDALTSIKQATAPPG